MMRKALSTLALALVLFMLVTPVMGRVEIHGFDSPQQEAQYRELIETLRCLVCQNQNIADSNAELAQDLRRQAYDMVTAGKSNEEIYTYMVERYGDFVLYEPPVRRSTLLLWAGPFIILVVGVGVLVTVIRRRNLEGVGQLSEGDLQRAERLLQQDDDKKDKE